jgi:hypothetical protein
MSDFIAAQLLNLAWKVEHYDIRLAKEVLLAAKECSPNNLAVLTRLNKLKQLVEHATLALGMQGQELPLESILQHPHTWKILEPSAQISEEHKFIFVHIPKCGGTSVDRSSLFPHKASGHRTLTQLQRLLGLRSKEFKVCTIARNPWDRLASAFYYLSEGGVNSGDEKIRQTHLLPFNSDFRSFLDSFCESPSKFLKILHMRPMVHFAKKSIAHGEFMSFQLEDADKEEKFGNFLGKPFSMKHERKRSSYPKNPKVYEESTFQAVKVIYSDDISEFSYHHYELSDIVN